MTLRHHRNVAKCTERRTYVLYQSWMFIVHVKKMSSPANQSNVQTKWLHIQQLLLFWKKSADLFLSWLCCRIKYRRKYITPWHRRSTKVNKKKLNIAYLYQVCKWNEHRLYRFSPRRDWHQHGMEFSIWLIVFLVGIELNGILYMTCRVFWLFWWLDLFRLRKLTQLKVDYKSGRTWFRFISI